MWKNFFLNIWNFEIYRINNNSIKISQIIIAVLTVFIGVTLSRKVSQITKERLLKIKNINENLVDIIEKFISKFLVFISFLIALPIAGIPVTIFNVLGGAAAIGIGFGLQHLFNNIISSFILMLEKPIKIGDIIELNGEKGIIQEIGIRRVKIRRVDGVDVLIPNSHFLEQSLVNWTLTDKNIRGNIKIGVAYGSDIEKVKSIFYEVIKKNKKVINHIEPKIIFSDFGNSSLDFKIYFWTRVNKPIELEEIESEIRFKLYNELNKNNITIPFPQMDVYLRKDEKNE
ncbi:MAG: hypothetical protein PWP46_1018 [Fusobacteriaceae bacterium]|jgi:small-conductance mechanosensitive channel|nr:mechanosensitive ion channel protein [Fusobacteriales bacterium]MDN5304138.1 hypothetical protein [Fusobacteriaceae bacterium]